MIDAPLLAVVIPVFNRPELLRYSLSSIRAARRDISLEVVIVDDGSTDKPDTVIGEFSDLPICTVRQVNSGSIPARLNGFRASTARYIQFLDSDDLVAPEKFMRQLDELERSDSDLVYCDAASVSLEGPYEALTPIPDQALRPADSLPEFCFQIQPNPHAAIYRRTLLAAALNAPIVSAARRYDPVGDAWLYYNLCTLSGRVRYTPGPWAIVGRHPGIRYSCHWEALGIAAWHMMKEFHQKCPPTAQTERARQLFGETCLAMWRALPRQFDKRLEKSLLEMWRGSPVPPTRHLGGPWFRAVASTIGTESAAHLFRRVQRPLYATIATLPAATLQNLLSEDPSFAQNTAEPAQES